MQSTTGQFHFRKDVTQNFLDAVDDRAMRALGGARDSARDRANDDARVAQLRWRSSPALCLLPGWSAGSYPAPIVGPPSP